jgi:hypothetical protein
MDMSRFSTEVDEVPQEFLVDIGVELAILEKPQKGRWQIYATSIFRCVR